MINPIQQEAREAADERCDICCCPKSRHLKRDLQCPQTTYFRSMPDNTAILAAEARGALAGAMRMREAAAKVAEQRLVTVAVSDEMADYQNGLVYGIVRSITALDPGCAPTASGDQP